MKRVIINADDFGYKSSVNKAIVESFNRGIITSTTIMANMPGFEEAVHLAHNNNLLTKIGIHLNLTEGSPLTQKILTTDLFYNENYSTLKKHKKALFLLNSDEKKVIFNEFSAQIEKVKRSGLNITHIDTHHHIDEVWSITLIILNLLKTYDIPSMRILYNLSNSTRIHKILYRGIINRFIKMKGANYSDFLGNQIEAISKLKSDTTFRNTGKMEIMVHPDYSSSGSLIDKIKNQEYAFNYPEELTRLILSRE